MKISKELMPVAWHPTKLWDWFMSEHEEKRNKRFLIYKKQYNDKVMYIVTAFYNLNSILKVDQCD